MDTRQDGPLSGGPAAAERHAGVPAIIGIRGVAKHFGNVAAVDAVSLDIARGEFFCLLGASGSGKTTLLRMIAGLDLPSRGHIVIDGEDVTGWPAHRRPVNMMFQSYALFPHLSVERNVAFGLQEEGRPGAEIRERVRSALDMFDMASLGARKPHQLSGGQRQRVALARALVKQPKILLLDEPLAALDKRLRERAQSGLVDLRERLGITFVMVTHDQEEAMSMASRIALMHDGKIVQLGTPRELYDAPCSRYVADFFGAANLFAGVLAEGAGDEAAIESAEAGGRLCGLCDERAASGAAATLMVRPEQVRLARTAPSDVANRLTGEVKTLGFLGSFYVCELRLESGKTVQARLSPAELTAAGDPEPGDRVQLYWPARAARVLVR